ncbi:hemerythrin domain-containing protein [Streptomyces synnematoformans]|uniref:Hemerythrin-like domain-containing protein n=1 Tax=Streptomyces synnematoformans TaxID=415721 RepID=A0ABN2ZB30_9ACTN
MSDTVDFTLMYAMHDALRRDLDHLVKAAARTDDDPRRVLAAAAGWELFKKVLHIHHTAEDEALWPPLTEALAGRPDDLAVVDAMEAEHAQIDPLLDAVDAALADRDHGPERLGGLVDELAGKLRAHLTHEEDDTLPLIERTLTAAQVQHFGGVHAAKGAADGPVLTAWMLEGADEKMRTAALAYLPEPVRAAYRDEWRPAFVARDWWGTGR